ncbi:gamma-glutamylcyclotransferase family protein [Halomonas llamarensis]|uniref:Gamma-glutamylcyclotransferase n=1 Tax=Halomonas llamarensis TaxID=2945104 RepID=A0ABT0SS20_9GAMM|nr:gamma-glutamylcyclotransferase family protein [Halomonas llamarensis]MCL7930587.1 gamma-glutamylcyclotransferase [Halomonas llamarensis]
MNHLQRDIQRCPRVAVYGTLKRGYRNHYWLEGAALLGQDRLSTITLYDLGPYPGAKKEASHGAVIEVYAITPEQLALLDQLEDYIAHAPHTGVYDRAIFPTQHGQAWCYLYNADVEGAVRIDSGEW